MNSVNFFCNSSGVGNFGSLMKKSTTREFTFQRDGMSIVSAAKQRVTMSAAKHMARQRHLPFCHPERERSGVEGSPSFPDTMRQKHGKTWRSLDKLGMT